MESVFKFSPRVINNSVYPLWEAEENENQRLATSRDEKTRMRGLNRAINKRKRTWMR